MSGRQPMLEFLSQRNSAPKLAEPGPTPEQLKAILRAALRAPDHKRLRPWRLLVIQGDARKRFGEVLANAGQRRNPNLPPEKVEKARNMPLRAPTLIVVAANVDRDCDVPVIEQQLSAGCVAHGLLLAAEALGYGAIWRTGDNAFDRHVHSELGLNESQEIVAFVYIGTRDVAEKPIPDHELSDYVSHWPD